jgi:anti-sigma regulatory factor (Ser/Thr protein kinase)
VLVASTPVSVTSRELVVEPHDHLVNVYDDDEDVVADVNSYLAEGLLAGEAAVVVATPAHLDAFDDGLRQRGVRVGAALDSGQYRPLDAGEMLASFMADGTPDRARFMTSIGGVIGDAAKHGDTVRAFGEMVALLWDASNVSGAIELESLWNDLARDHRFSLYCAYPMASLATNGDLGAVRQVCDHHSSLVAPRSYASGAAASFFEDGPTERSQLFVPVPLAIRAVRRFVTDALHGWGENALVNEANIVASELATNAVVHATSPFRVSVQRCGSTVKIAVEDQSPAMPRRLDQPAGAIGGRGVALVAGLCSNWGTEVQSDGKTVWAELVPTPR